MNYDPLRPDDEDVGIRAMDVRREKAVERAMQLMRHGLGEQATTLAVETVADLEYAFGEVWRFVAHSEWDQLSFGHLTLDDIARIQELAQELHGDCHNATAVIGEIESFLLPKG